VACGVCEVCGVWSVECGVWCVVCGVWSVECGVWSVECGGWSVECGVWRVERGVCLFSRFRYARISTRAQLLLVNCCLDTRAHTKGLMKSSIHKMVLEICVFARKKLKNLGAYGSIHSQGWGRWAADL